MTFSIIKLTYYHLPSDETWLTIDSRTQFSNIRRTTEVSEGLDFKSAINIAYRHNRTNTRTFRSNN